MIPVHLRWREKEYRILIFQRFLFWIRCTFYFSLLPSWFRTIKVRSNITLRLVWKFSHKVVSESPRPHGLWYASLPCPSRSPGVGLNSCPLSQWCHPAISCSVAHFSSCPQSSDKTRSTGEEHGKPLQDSWPQEPQEQCESTLKLLGKHPGGICHLLGYIYFLIFLCSRHSDKHYITSLLTETVLTKCLLVIKSECKLVPLYKLFYFFIMHILSWILSSLGNGKVWLNDVIQNCLK